MSLFKTTLWLAAALHLVLAAPTPQSTPGDILTAHSVPVTYTVGCGCWNLCTLEKVIKPDLVCDLTCDAEFLCDAPLAKRDVFPPHGPMPFNPFGPGGLLEDSTTIKEKRTTDRENDWPWDTPKGSIPRPLARKDPIKTVPTYPPPYVKEEELERRNDLVARTGSLSASGTERCTEGKCTREVTVSVNWNF